MFLRIPTLVFLCCTFIENNALAEKRIVVMDFSGPQGNKAADLIRKTLKKQYTLVSHSSFRRFVLGTEETAQNKKIVAARALGVSGIVQGSISRLQGRWILRIIVLSGHNAKSIGSETALLNGTRLDRATAQQISKKIAFALRKTKAPTEADNEMPEHLAKPSASKYSQTPMQEQTMLPKTTSLNDNLGFQVNDADALSTTNQRMRQKRKGSPNAISPFEEQKKSAPRPLWEKIIEISPGFIFMYRTFDFNPPKSQSHYSGVIPAILAQGEIYPFAGVTRGFWADIGIVGNYFRSIGLTSQMGTSQPADTLLHGFEAGLRDRWNILGKSTSPIFRLGADFGKMGFFILDNEIQKQLPNISYLYINFAPLDFEMPFYVGESFSIGGTLIFNYMFVLSSGNIERADSYGYGPSNTGGIKTGAGIYASYKGFFVKLSGFYKRFFFTFDCIPLQQCKDVAGALDQYIGGSLNLGYGY